ncbi:uncharacterized protein SAPINGB_P004194 [Magnusiomyces paraingens]|uniref:SKP1 component POZ domain-containing protein n=1 Tax=Magnusiomyces paraingens TaxID=2606893 RepID=A0A5E8BVC6_9ASCO|nr:uncharacterized protein SAPINGB_P004194 [Saprochaete ingens]VVT54674.1 unnamed protein product [Saprochaete ingens]
MPAPDIIPPVQPPTEPQTNPSDGKIILVSANGDEIPLSRKAVKLSKTLENMVKTHEDSVPPNETLKISLSMIATNVVTKVVEYLEYHKEESMESWVKTQIAERGPDYTLDTSYMRQSLEISVWDKSLFEDESMHVAPSYVFAIVVAANVLTIEMLQDLCKKMLANLIKGLNNEDARRLLGICGDYGLTREMEKNVYKQRNMSPSDHPIDLNMQKNFKK